MPDPQHRAADTDREAVAATLGRALSEGRLRIDEYEDRLAQAYAARTYAELDALTRDLPRPAPAPAVAPGPDRAPRPAGSYAPAPRPHGSLRMMWAPWLTTALIVIAIWLATSIASGGGIYFWPIWVILPWGAVLLAHTLGGGPRRPHNRSHDRSRRYR